MINEKKSTATRPSMILWLIGLLVFIKAPIIFSIYSIITALGLTDHSLAILLSILFGLKITNWFEELNEEVIEYIEKL
jgi:predicted tellurium resistance membrane protein TerC